VIARGNIRTSPSGRGAAVFHVIALFALFAFAGVSGACRRATAAGVADAEPPAPVVRAGVVGLLFTWIDDKGDFHVETRLDDVPLMGRDVVRVENQNEEAPNPERVVIADLRQAGADGAYPTRSMTRADFEALAVARREKNGPTMAGAAPSSSRSLPAEPTAAPRANPGTRPVVVIYGAEWCGACHEAARYLRHKGIPYVEKDIEKDPAAAREMQEKLAKHGMNAGSIPVIDVRGTVMVGFNPPAIDSALGQAL
jgi:glutaredoxin